MPAHTNQLPSPEKTVKRILLLEASNVGCSPYCTCRAQLALIMGDMQEAKLREHVAKVTFDGVRTDEGVVKNILKDGLEELEIALLDKMALDRNGKSREEVWGGVSGAQIALINLFQIAGLMLTDGGQPSSGSTLS